MKRLLSFFLVSCMIFSANIPAFAKERTWMGLSPSGPEMSNWLNWSWAQTPDDGDSLKFSTDFNARKNVLNDFDGYTFSGITFSSSARDTSIKGNPINLNGNINNSSSKLQIIDLNMNLLRNVNLYSGDGSYDLKLGGIISGGYSISKNGTSTLILGGVNTYAGTTTISQGTLQLGASGAIPASSAVAISSGATLSLKGYSDTMASLSGDGTVNNNSATNATLTVGDTTSKTFSGTIVNGSTGELALTKQGSGTLILTGANTYTGNTTISAGTLQIGNNGTTGSLSTGSSITDNGILSFYRTDTVTQGTDFASVIAGSGGVTQAGSGTLTLSGANTYTGTTTITNGTLTLDATGTIATSAGVANAGTFIIQGNKTIGYLTGAGTTTLGANTLTITDTGIYSGIAGGTGGLTMNGAGKTLTLSGANTYSGGTNISSGVVNAITSAEALGTGTVSVASGSALQLTGALDFNEALTIRGTGISGAGALRHISGNTTYSGNITLGAASRINSDADTLTLSGATINGAYGLTIGGAGNTGISGVIATGANTLTKDGTGMLTLSGANTYTGATTINAGTLVLDYSTQNNSKISESAALIMGGGTLSLSGGTYAQSVASTTLSAGDSFLIRPSGTAVLQMNTITMNKGATIDFSVANIAKTNNNNDPVSGILGPWATIADTDWAKKNAGAGENGFIVAFDGYTDIAAYGGIIANGANQVRINSKGTSGNITLDSAGTAINTLLQSTAYDATVDTTGKTLRANGIMIGEGKGALTIGLDGAAGTLTSATSSGDIDLINYSNDKNLTINAVIADNGGALTLTKAGDGTLTLNGINTYTGATIVDGGTLNLNQNLSASSELAFGSSATVNLASGKNLGCKVTTDEDGVGTLNFLGGTQSASKDIGAAGMALEKVDVASGTTTFNGDLYATTLSFSGDGTAIIASGKSITGNVDTNGTGQGTLTLSGGNQIVSGSIGSTYALNTVNIGAGTGETATFSGSVDAQTINMNGVGSAAFGDNMTGAVKFGADGTVTLASGKSIAGSVDNNTSSSGRGTLKFLGGIQSISGDIGSTKTLKLVDVASGTVTFEGNVKATTLNFSGDGTANIASGKSITGDVDNSTSSDGKGTLYFLGGTQSVSGNIGTTNTLNRVDVASGTTTFNGNVKTSTLSFSDDGTAIIASGKSVTGAVDNLSGTTNQGTLTLYGGNQTVSGNIGGTNALKTVNVGAGTGETATFGGSVNAQTVNILSTGTAAFNGGTIGVVGNIIFDNDGFATFANNKGLIGDITSPSGEGTVTLLGTSTMIGNIGSNLLGNNGIKLLTVGNGAVEVEGDIRALTVNFAGDNELSIDSGYSIGGVVTTSTNNSGTLTFLGSTSTGGDIGSSSKALKVVNFNGATTLSNDIYATNTNIGSDSTVTLTGNAKVTGNLALANSADSVLGLGSNTLTIAGTGGYNQGADSEVQLQLSSADHGNIIASGIASNTGTTKLDIDIDGYLATGTSYTFITGGAGSSLVEPIITWDSPLFTLTYNGDSQHLSVSVVRSESYHDAALNSNAAAVGAAMDNAPNTGDMLTVKGQLDGFASRQEITSALDTMHPTADMGVIETTNNSLDDFVGATVLRLQDSKVEEAKDKNTPKNNNIPSENNLWAQTYGDYANQGSRGLSNGYLARLWGTAIGIDRSFMDNSLRLGLVQGFAGSQVLSADSSGRTGITSYQTGLYGEYEGKNHPYILDAVLTYGYNNYDSSRSINVGTINRTASSNYAAQQFSSYLEGGYKFKKKNFDITPLLAIDYTHLHIAGYTESGADSLNLSVDAQNYDTLKVGTGCRISRAFDTKNMLFTPELHFRYFYAAINDKQQTLASFAGGGTSFETNGYRPASSSFNLGARLEFFNKKNLTLLADCDTAFKDGYYELGGSVTVKYSF